MPFDLFYNLHDFIAQIFHRDEPLINKAEDELRLAAPAGWVAVLIVLWAVKETFLGKVLGDLQGYIRGWAACEPIITFHINAIFIDGRKSGQVIFFAEVKVFMAAARSDVDNTSTL